MNLRTRLRTTEVTRFLTFAAGLSLAASLIAGCSNAISPDAGSNIASAAVDVPVLITDAPSDQLASFSLTLQQGFGAASDWLAEEVLADGHRSGEVQAVRQRTAVPA
jgi:hypothetical protein